MYVYLGLVGNCSFNLDGRLVGRFSQSLSNATEENTIHLAYHDFDLPAAPHVLTMYPEDAGHVIVLDYVVYRCVAPSSLLGSRVTKPGNRSRDNSIPRKTRVGAIVGGVVGGLAAAGFAILWRIYFLRRQKQRRLSRSIRLRDSWTDKPSIKLAEMAHQK